MSSSPIPDQARSIPSTSQDTAMRQPTAPVLGTPWTRSATKVALLGAGEIGKEVTIALNYLYVAEPIKAIGTENIVFEFTEPMKAITMRPEPAADYFHIIMPMNPT